MALLPQTTVTAPTTSDEKDILPILKCAYCTRLRPAFGMVKAGSTPFCSSLHATLFVKHNKKPAAKKEIGVAKVITGIAVEKIISALKLRDSAVGQRPPSPHPHQELSQHQYGELSDQFKTNGLWLNQHFSEALRTDIEAELEAVSKPNAAISIEGPIDVSMRNMMFFDSDIVRGPADYFIIKEGGYDRLAMRIQLASNPVWIGKLRS